MSFIASRLKRIKPSMTVGINIKALALSASVPSYVGFSIKALDLTQHALSLVIDLVRISIRALE